ncbi:UDP-N-acetylglucosamine pyrophosphorylase [Phakopsora pachyrhizi]|uniref:UDP-N-acetylglucosamine diphosphorylase n=1 Tax=Phakopsora pachyrhizi TaxID=170000 RepID=A0AAV0BEE0_PHAPC|nr:UDP-N-acetylglucosamine pyrophosphorylase [Phakopsora pachyrhizi]
MTDHKATRLRYERAGQGHLFNFFDDLNDQEKSQLLNQLDSIDPERVQKIFKNSIETKGDSSDEHQIEPPPTKFIESIIGAGNVANIAEWRSKGLDAVKDGKVGVLLLAGGQGTRLGSSDPKGCYDIGLPSKKSLFQLQAEKILRLQILAGGSAIIPWYVMTSGPTRKNTEDFFKKHRFFGLDPKNVIFFEQGVLPALTMEGKMFLESPSRVSVAPDGNGGLYAGLRSKSLENGLSVLEDLKERGVKYVHAYCVDNCLVKVADPIFIGFSIAKKTPCSLKVVVKSNPAESVGVMALKNKRWSVVEYSEMPENMASRLAPNGELSFKSANIANHFYTREFLESIQSFESQLAYHVAHKKIPHIDLKTKKVVKPTKPNGIKLELFIFDVFPFLDSMYLLEVKRSEEFSPLKNAPGTGVDDPETSRRDLLEQQKRWLVNAGAQFDNSIDVEISPLISYAGEGLEGASGKFIKKSIQINSLEDISRL